MKISGRFVAEVICVLCVLSAALHADGAQSGILRRAKPAPHLFGTFFKSDADAQNILPLYEDTDALENRISPVYYYEPPANGILKPSPVFEQPAPPAPSAQDSADGAVFIPIYNSSISLTGRKVVGFGYSGKKYLNPQTTYVRPSSSGGMTAEQEMQITMKGKVGRKVTVNIDYDDKQSDKQDVSVVYDGDKDEIVQRAAFGDIDLSLPSSEFVSYNRQLFGIRTDLKYKNLKTTVIGSKTKGKSKNRRFIGNTLFQSKDVLDTDYIRRRYYDIAFGYPGTRLPIITGSEKIYLDTQSASAQGTTERTADDLGVDGVSYTGQFKRLVAGTDYTVDYAKGIITFTYPLGAGYVVAIDYQYNYGGSVRNLAYNSAADPFGTSGTGNIKLIKTSNDAYITSSSEMGWNRELKTFYTLGQTQIVRDNGLGNFSLIVQENRENVGTSLTPPQVYPSTIEVDFEKGVFRLLEPFGGAATPDPDIYASTPKTKRNFRVEYNSRVKTFFLESDIVIGSETVEVNGVKFKANTDYYIDYDTGFITFYTTSAITDTTVIDVSYEVKGLGGSNSSSLIGARVSYDITDNLSAGSSFLYESPTKPVIAPHISSLTQDLVVYEGDVALKDFKIADGIKSNVELEAAESRSSANISGYAIIENMESVKESDGASLEKILWQVAANPTAGVYTDLNDISWDNEDIPVRDINPNIVANTDEKQRVLTLQYDFTNSSEISIVFPYSESGLDFSRKTMMELVIYSSTDLGPDINVHLGQINEDSDGTGGETLICSGVTRLGAPKTEDKNCDGILGFDQYGSSEDMGWVYSPSGFTAVSVGAVNGKIDTQDLDGDGIMDYQDGSGGDFGYLGLDFTDTNDANTPKHTLNFTGWHTLQAPMNIASSDESKWSAVKQIRITLRKPAGGANTGTIKMARAAVSGNTWTDGNYSAGSTLNLSAVNNVDNPDYKPIYAAGGAAGEVFSNLYGSVNDQASSTTSGNVSEQALSLSYDLPAGGYSETQKYFTTSADFTTHKEIRFLLYGFGASENEKFYLRAGTDTDYMKISVPLNFDGWRLYRIEQTDTDGDGFYDTWQNISSYTAEITSLGKINLNQVNIITAGVENTDAVSHTGKVWFNELHAAVPKILKGSARKVKADFDIDGWVEFGYKYKTINSEFETPGSVSAHQDDVQKNAYIKLKRIKHLPVQADYYSREIFTPDAYSTTDGNSVSILDSGKVKKEGGAVSVGFDKEKLPKIKLTYSKHNFSYEALEREDNINSYITSLDYDVPVKTPFLPDNVSLEYANQNSKTTYSEDKLLAETNYNTEEITNMLAAKLVFKPIKNSSLQSEYSLKDVNEKRQSYEDAVFIARSYNKSMNQRASLRANLRVLPWLNPGFNCASTIIETNNITSTTATLGSETQSFDVGQIKTINRTTRAGATLTINASDIFPSVKPVKGFMFITGYQLDDGDTWTNVESGLNTKSALWVRTPLSPSSLFASRTNMTTNNSFTFTQNWRPFAGYETKGAMSPLGTLSVTNDYSQKNQKTEVTGTSSRTDVVTFPDTVISLSGFEKFFGSPRWFSGSSATFRYTKIASDLSDVNKDDETRHSFNFVVKLFNFLDTVLIYNDQTIDKQDILINQNIGHTEIKNASAQGTITFAKVSVTPKIDYKHELKREYTSYIAKDLTEITPGILVRADLNKTKTTTNPETGVQSKTSRRLILTNSLNYSMRKSPALLSDNSRALIFKSEADYEISKNLRLTFGAGAEMWKYKYIPEEDYISYLISSKLTLQF